MFFLGFLRRLKRESFGDVWSVLYGTTALVLVGGLIVGLIAFFTSQQTVYRLTLSAGSPQGLYYPLAQRVAELVRNTDPRVQIEVIESKGSMQNVDRLIEGTADLALAQNDATGSKTDSKSGTPDGREVIRTLTPLHVDVLHILVREDRKPPIRNLQDFESLRVAVGEEGSGSRPIANKLFEHYGVVVAEENLHEMGLEQAVKALRASEIDAFLFMVGLDSVVMCDCLREGNIRFLPLGSRIGPGSETDGFLLHYPFAESFIIPRMAYSPGNSSTAPSPSEPIPAVAVRNLLIGREDLPLHAARIITEAIHRNRSALVQEFPGASQITETFDRSRLHFPLHEGAEHYFARNEPSWLTRNAELIGVIFSCLAGIVAAFAAGYKWWGQRLKDRLDVYFLDLNQLLSRLHDPSLPESEVHEIRDRITAIREEAFILLAEEKLFPNNAFGIFQALLQECETALRSRDAYR